MERKNDTYDDTPSVDVYNPMSSGGYENTKQKILSALMNRPNGTKIQPANHQDYALSLLEYIRNVELISASTLIGVAYEDTVPVQPNTSNAAYVAGVAQQKTAIFENFRDKDGQPIIVTTGEMEAKLVVLFWNRQYWEKEEISANIISESENAYFFYSFRIRKTYSSKAEMEGDVFSPIGNDGRKIQFGEIVSVSNESNESENAIYSYEFDSREYWKLQIRLEKLDSRTLDGGRADTKFGGSLIIDCGKAN